MGGSVARVGAGGRDRSGLIKAWLRARACCDVAPANAVCYLASEGEHIGAQILHAWDDQDRQGWFEGRVHGRNLNARDLARAPTANFSVRYGKSLTVGVKKK